MISRTFLTTCLYGIDRALRRLTRSACCLRAYTLFSLSLPPNLPELRRRAGTTVFRELSRSEIHTYTWPRPKQVIDFRLQQDCRVLAAVSREGDLLAFIWFTSKAYVEDEVQCVFAPGPEGQVVWDFDVYIQPQLRMGRLFAQLWRAFDALMKSEGIGYSVSRISMFNSASLTSHARLGAEAIGWTVFLCIGTSFQIFLGSVRPFFRCSRTARSKPVIRVSAHERPSGVRPNESLSA